MVNSGSIIVNSLLQTLMKPDMTSAEKFDEINNYIKRMAGDEYVSFNNSVFLAEREVSDRNYALSYYMKENNCFPKGKKHEKIYKYLEVTALQVVAKLLHTTAFDQHYTEMGFDVCS